MRAIQVQEFGGPDVLEVTDLPRPEPGDGQLLIEVDTAGINYADTHQAENSYLSEQSLPFVPGGEVVGTVRGGDRDGERVAAFVTEGGYAEWAVASEQAAFGVPDGVSDLQAVALLVQGLTAWHLLRTSSHMQAGETVVVHAAAGGVGTLLVQLAVQWGAGRVIGTASSEEKRALAEELGAHATIDSRAEELTDALREANGGERVDVILEMVGGRTFEQSLRALAPFGRLVTYGMASREETRPVPPGALLSRSRAVIGFWLAHCFRRPDMLVGPMRELLEMVQAGTLQVQEGERYPLERARDAHEDLRARRTTGKLVLDLRSA